MSASNLSALDYFHGFLSRRAAERTLRQSGCVDGSYLLRLSPRQANQFAFAICNADKVFHYVIEQRLDGKFTMKGGNRRHDSIPDLIKYHSKTQAGMVVRPKKACKRQHSSPYVWPGVTCEDLQREAERHFKFEKAKNGYSSGSEEELRRRVVAEVKKIFHKTQPWYFENMNRTEAELSLRSFDHPLVPPDGRFLVRENGRGTCALSLAFRNEIIHYEILVLSTNNVEKLSINGLDTMFENLMDLVAMCHHDGLACPLDEPCTTRAVHDMDMEPSPIYRTQTEATRSFLPSPVLSIEGAHSGTRQPHHWPTIQTTYPVYREDDTDYRRDEEYDDDDDVEVDGNEEVRAEVDYSTVPREEGKRQLLMESNRSARNISRRRAGEEDDEDDVKHAGARFKSETALSRHSDPYYLSPRDDVFNISLDQLEFNEDRGRLGEGQFGTVKVATYWVDDNEFEVAVKTLHQIDSHLNEKSELVREARLMRSLDNPNIIRLIGLCVETHTKRIMLVMELASLGPLKNYLASHRETSMTTIIDLLIQVANGMAYLESRNVVHRDLAARNVLLVDPLNAKISDFGLSRALSMDQSYYPPSDRAQRLPLKWYPPEFFKHHKFDSKSDVWSYGITMWEATSFGDKPYKGLSLQEYRNVVDAGDRLENPRMCPTPVYEIMTSCWAKEKNDRPTFTEILASLRDVQARRRRQYQ